MRVSLGGTSGRIKRADSRFVRECVVDWAKDSGAAAKHPTNNSLATFGGGGGGGSGVS